MDWQKKKFCLFFLIFSNIDHDQSYFLYRLGYFYTLSTGFPSGAQRVQVSRQQATEHRIQPGQDIHQTKANARGKYTDKNCSNKWIKFVKRQKM